MFGVGTIGSLGGAAVPGTASLDPAAIALFARMTSQPTPTRMALINTMIVSLKGAGLWSTSDAIWVMAAADSQAMTLNWVQNLYNLTPVNSPTFVVDRGVSGDGSTSYLNTGLSPGAGGLQYSTNSCHMSCYVRTSRAANSVYDMGFYDGSSATAIVPFDASNNFSRFCDDISGLTQPSPGSTGLFSVDRDNSANFRGYIRGASETVSVSSSIAPVGTAPVYICGINLGGTPTLSTDQIAFGRVGSQASAAQEAQLYSIVQAYMTGVGANV